MDGSTKMPAKVSVSMAGYHMDAQYMNAKHSAPTDNPMSSLVNGYDSSIDEHASR